MYVNCKFVILTTSPIASRTFPSLYTTHSDKRLNTRLSLCISDLRLCPEPRWCEKRHAFIHREDAMIQDEQTHVKRRWELSWVHYSADGASTSDDGYPTNTQKTYGTRWHFSINCYVFLFIQCETNEGIHVETCQSYRLVYCVTWQLWWDPCWDFQCVILLKKTVQSLLNNKKLQI